MLGLIQAATGEMGLAVPDYVAGNTDADVMQILALMNQSGNELQREFDWQQSIVEYRFTTQYTTTTGTTTNGSAVVTGIPSTSGLTTNYGVTGTGINQDTYILSVDSSTQVTLTQAASASGTGVSLTFGQMKYAMPTDYDRQINRTHWDKSKHWEMLGPETAQQWQWLKSGYISTGPRIRYRQLGNEFQIWPLMTSNEYLGFEYVSKYWALSASASNPDKSSFTVDTDTCIFPDRLIINDTKRKFFGVKGFDTTRFDADFARDLTIAKSANGGAQTLSMNPQQSNILITWNNVPDSGYGI